MSEIEKTHVRRSWLKTNTLCGRDAALVAVLADSDLDAGKEPTCTRCLRSPEWRRRKAPHADQSK